MKRGVCIIAAALSAVLLTGCNRYGTDLPKKYKSFLDYTFDGDYEVVLNEQSVINVGTEHEEAFRDWSIIYSDINGIEHIGKIRGRKLSDNYKDSYYNQTRYNDFEMAHFVEGEIMKITRYEFVEEVLSKHLNGEFDDHESYYIGEGCKVLFVPFSPLYDLGDMCYEIAKRGISDEEGYELWKCDLSTFANNDEYLFMVIFTLQPDADAVYYEKLVREIESDFLEYTGGVCNYQFLLKQNGDDNNAQTIYKHAVFQGEEFVPDASIEGDNLPKAVYRYLEQKYK
ncbi:MAG: hypothetical protein E7504_07150 [Ruminococcus sp.]|nr:hypothetical protein [Ruminococcus sp.]